MKNNYALFAAMIATSTVVMFGLMYLNTYALDHLFFSETRTYMALLMGATMAIIMLSFMLGMYKNQRVNIGIFVGSIAVFALSLWLVRSQTTVDDVSWMRAMIPHHSIAILTSERANISDPRVRRLADDIILAQRREIAEMKALIAELGDLDYEAEPLPSTVPPVEGGSESIPGAPSLTLNDDAVVGDVVLLAQTQTNSDAWAVVHPATSDGSPDASRALGRAFLLHGVNENVPIGLSGATSSETLFVMLHDDTGEIGVFEFSSSGTLDAPLEQSGSPVVAPFTIQ